jgi:hypothetical protein
MKANNTGQTNIKVVGKYFQLTFVFNALKTSLNLYLNTLIALILFFSKLEEYLASKHAYREAIVDGRLSYQSSYGFASGQIPRRSRGTLLPSSGEPKVSNPWNNVQRKDSI